MSMSNCVQYAGYIGIGIFSSSIHTIELLKSFNWNQATNKRMFYFLLLRFRLLLFFISILFFFYQTNTQKNYNRFAAYCLSSTYKSRYIQYINIGLFFVCSSCYSLFWVSFDFSSSSGSFLSRFFFFNTIHFNLFYLTWFAKFIALFSFLFRLIAFNDDQYIWSAIEQSTRR